MVLPSGVNKATGLAVALEELGLSAHNRNGHFTLVGSIARHLSAGR